MADIRSLARTMARSLYDPGRYQDEYRAEKTRLRGSLYAEDAASYALPGSIAEREDPNRFGSVAGRFSGRFNNQGLSATANDGVIPTVDNPAVISARNARSKLRRKQPFDYDAAEDLLGTDDLFGGDLY
jgi:hypothetical protein